MRTKGSDTTQSHNAESVCNILKKKKKLIYNLLILSNSK